MEDETRKASKRHLVALMQTGHSWQEASAQAGIQVSRSTAYRWLQRVRVAGEASLTDGRHGHPAKLRPPVREFLAHDLPRKPSAFKPSNPGAAPRALRGGGQHRAPQSLPRDPGPGKERSFRGKNVSSRPPQKAAQWQEGAGGLLLVAAANATGLLTVLTKAISDMTPKAPSRLARHTLRSRQMMLLTLLFFGAVGLRRTWDLRSYTGDALGLLTSRKRAYSYLHMERFLSEVARANGAEMLTDALAGWTAQLWLPFDREEAHQSAHFSIDGHRKPVYTQALIPRGLVGRLSTILGCRALVLLHDASGHPRLSTTHRGDQHLTVGLPAMLKRYEQSGQAGRVEHMVVDREGMAAEFLAGLKKAGRTVISVLRTEKSAGLDSFTDIGRFVPLHVSKQGEVLRKARTSVHCSSLT